MKRIKLLAFIVILLCVISVPSFSVGASSALINNTTKYTKNPNTDLSGITCDNYNTNYVAPGSLHCLYTGYQIDVHEDIYYASTIDSCSTGFYKVDYTKSNNRTYHTGYICADDLTFESDIDNSAYSEEYEANNVPVSYQNRITLIRNNYPNWKFNYVDIDIDYSTAATSESFVGKSYIQTSDEKYLSLDYPSYQDGAYTMREAGGWYAANLKTVAHYMDPRNYLDEIHIFGFETLSYDSSFHNLELVQSIFEGTALYDYSNNYLQAGIENNTSPIGLAARSKQEVVVGSGLSSAADGSLGYYNVYNIGAYSSCTSPVVCGNDWASGYIGTTSETTSYLRPWDTIEKSIAGGAAYLAGNYVNSKDINNSLLSQNTLYFQKFDFVQSSVGDTYYSHQYMTNITAPYTESYTVYSSYKDLSVLDKGITFMIPIFQNMPDTNVKLPTSVDEGTKLIIDNITDIDPDISSLADLINGAGFKYSNSFVSNLGAETNSETIKTTINAMDNDTTVSIKRNGTELTDDQTLATGDQITITTLIDEEEKTFELTAVIYGDVSGEGEISALDLLQVQKNILNFTTLDGGFSEAGDVNKDGVISALDLLLIKKHLLGDSTISG